MSWLEGGGDDDVAALGLLRAQEDTAGVDVDGAGGPVLQAVHTVLAVLLHLTGVETSGHTEPLTPPRTPHLPLVAGRGVSTESEVHENLSAWGWRGGRWMQLGGGG